MERIKQSGAEARPVVVPPRRSSKYENLRFIAGAVADESIQATMTEAIAENGEEIVYISTQWVGGNAAIICITGRRRAL